MRAFVAPSGGVGRDRREDSFARGRRTRRALVTLAVLAGCSGGSSLGPSSGTFAVTPTSASLQVGQSVQLTAVDAPGTVAWSSSDGDVATVVPETGFVTAHGPGTATVSAVSESETASAEITVTAPPAIGLATPTLEFDVTEGADDPPAGTVAVTNAGDGTLGGLGVGTVEYSPGQPTGWLSAELDGASTPATLTVSVTGVGLPLGTYSAAVPVTSDGATNSPQKLLVTFRVLGPPSIVASVTDLALVALPDETDEATVDVTNGGGGPLTGLTATVAYGSGMPRGWLDASLDTDAAPATLSLTGSAGSLEQRTYEATVTLSTDVPGVDPVTVAVHFTVSPGPAVVLDPANLYMAAAPGTDAPPVEVAVTNGGGGTLGSLRILSTAYGAGQPSGWLGATLEGTTAPTTLTLTPSTASLPEGSYAATVSLYSPEASNTPIAVRITLDVAPPPIIAVSPGTLTFSSFQGATADPAPQGVSVTNDGGSRLTGLSATATYDDGDGWLDLSWQAGSTTAPAVLMIQPVTGPLKEGTHTATVEISTDIAGVEPKPVDVTFVVTSFTTTVYPILVSECQGCHSAETSSPSTAHSWAVAPSSNTYCRLLVGSGGSCSKMPPDPDWPMPQAELDAYRSWYAAGSPYQ